MYVGAALGQEETPEATPSTEEVVSATPLSGEEAAAVEAQASTRESAGGPSSKGRSDKGKAKHHKGKKKSSKKHRKEVREPAQTGVPTQADVTPSDASASQ
jgi:hypothetical protein